MLVDLIPQRTRGWSQHEHLENSERKKGRFGSLSLPLSLLALPGVFRPVAVKQTRSSQMSLNWLDFWNLWPRSRCVRKGVLSLTRCYSYRCITVLLCDTENTALTAWHRRSSVQTFGSGVSTVSEFLLNASPALRTGTARKYCILLQGARVNPQGWHTLTVGDQPYDRQRYEILFGLREEEKRVHQAA